MSDLSACRAILGNLIAMPTVSADSNLAIISYIADRLEHAGARVEVMPSACGTKANLFATLGPDRPGGLMFSGHTDVVPVADQPWTSDPFRMEEREGLLYGRGTCDMKGFIAACLARLDDMAEAAQSRPIHFAFTHDEEVGCLGARSLAGVLRDREARPSLAIIGEPTDMAPIEGHKGCCEYTVTFTGSEGHGSAPERGVNAVEYAARYVARLLELRQALIDRAPAGSRFDPPHSTINVGALKGGHAHNVIAGHAVLDWEMRPVVPADMDFVKADLAALVRDGLLPEMQRVFPGAGIATEVIGEVAGLIPMDSNAARDLIQRLTGANGAGVVPFGTEAGLFQEIGMEVVICGPGSIAQAHRPDEFVSLDQLGQCLDLLGRICGAVRSGTV
ncbi:acetylornithine deacetylase [Oceanicola sp. 22II-s10i]|uniref:acetylornithine deacetylase n=1 Tax=Oceanicola sp. 22II-s10i TaxID=1317116 RepID=UPI000B52475E|nr:acetylornithine deacetylase [Oceanicola sp. 22II-s10i]OWU85700.1 acetylornithine deacetylase [Oceanicola sp. 22II-s10i]